MKSRSKPWCLSPLSKRQKKKTKNVKLIKISKRYLIDSILGLVLWSVETFNFVIIEFSLVFFVKCVSPQKVEAGF